MTLHTILSYAKSAIRIVAFIGLGLHCFTIAAFGLILAETVGVLEELPGAYKGTQTS